MRTRNRQARTQASWKAALLVFAWFVTPLGLHAQTLAWPDKPQDSGTALERQVPALARKVLAGYEDPDRERELINRVRLQMAAGQPKAALASIAALREVRRETAPEQADVLFIQYEIDADARLRGETNPAAAFRRAFTRLDDRQAARTLPVMGADLPRARRDLDAALEKQRGKTRIEQTDALELIRLYQFHTVYAALLPVLPDLLAEDEARRYVIERDVVVPGADGTSLRGLVVRPRSMAAPQPVLLGFTIYVNDSWSLADAKAAAAHGYVGMFVYSRGKAGAPGEPVPYEHDGEDAAAAIDWISRQPWCDGRVGMYGNSYNSFTQWSAAKHRPPALKAMLTSASTAPGIDIPMQGNIFLNFLYPWPLWTAANATLDADSYGDEERWRQLDANWYRSGRAYRDLPAIDGHPNPYFSRWLEHPTYDAYWQAMTPQGGEFAGIDIPVLAVTGYFDGARVGVQHYFDEHARHNPNANHTLLIGPYNHFSMQAGAARVQEGYEVDPVALIDLPALRFQWFDHVLRGAPRPDVLKDRINYQVMGANTWKHAATLDAMANQRQRLYLQPATSGGPEGALSEQAPGKRAESLLTVDFSDRSDVGWNPPALSMLDALDPHGALVFRSAPLTAPAELSGLFSGRLDFITNKRDFDLNLALYEQLPDGRHLLLSWHLGRASHARDRSRRELLAPGKPQSIAFRSERLVSRQLQPGSRLVVVLGVNKQRDLQINYGSGKEVGEETIADAGAPLEIRWRGSSHIEVPLLR
ncbi:CocE/NonD family hydrolase [Pseudoxanthomonas sp. 22568]|uniref:CocE/NonD family hydrolase n=1 Tax=Pseudoxanthomonas sp. 22568 TaxID=3453945 RepID=UPI003F83A44C